MLEMQTIFSTPAARAAANNFSRAHHVHRADSSVQRLEVVGAIDQRRHARKRSGEISSPTEISRRVCRVWAWRVNSRINPADLDTPK